MHTGAELLRVGQAMSLLPKIAAAFDAGELSFDKARQITTVATPATEEFLLEIARSWRGSAARCDGLPRRTLPSKPTTISPGVVSGCIGTSTGCSSSWPGSRQRMPPWFRLRLSRSPVRGRCPNRPMTARRIGCDAEVVGVVERNGLPIDVGRKQRMVPDRLRLALHVRDRFCRFPGCGVPAYRTEAHHHEHWALGGEINLDNLLLLCGFHHRRHHAGAYRIRKTAAGFSFETDDWHAIQPSDRDPVSLKRNPDIGPSTPFSLWGGEAMQFSYAVSVIADVCDVAEARAAPPN